MKRGTIFSIVAFVLFVVVTQFFNSDERDAKEFSKKAKITLRQVGNELLLSNQDSTSLILPVKKVKNNTFELSFQSNLLFLPDSLVSIAKRNLDAIDFSKNYQVEVIQCIDEEIAYSYEINIDKEKTIVPCTNRVLPLNCYTIQFQFLDQSKASNFWLWYVLFFLILVIIEFFSYKKSTQKKQNETPSEYESLGSFRFYPQQSKLIKEAEEIALSKKECELLEIFVMQPNQVIKREDLTKRVWEDNGVFVGRSLDTYISKLRKKLQDDDRIKITNIHGVGYKLEINS